MFACIQKQNRCSLGEFNGIRNKCVNKSFEYLNTHSFAPKMLGGGIQACSSVNKITNHTNIWNKNPSVSKQFDNDLTNFLTELENIENANCVLVSVGWCRIDLPHLATTQQLTCTWYQEAKSFWKFVLLGVHIFRNN